MQRIDKLRKKHRGSKDWSFSGKQSLGSLYEKELRNRPTPAELMFGNYLCEMQLIPFDFQRQVLTPKMYILDFYMERYFVAFEIDGSVHKGREGKDAERDAILKEHRGIKTYRFTNEEVLRKPDQVKAKIRLALEWK